ncbi:MAG TPA: AMP-binding protein [Burkholderiales bacterium]|jgi:acyl-coenzyme A synthetase/AMP-(fatty) acid ligase
MPAIALLADDRPDAIIAYRGGIPVRVARFLGDVAQAAARLPPSGPVMNLCADRYRFTVALAAALSRGRMSLLPPSAAPEVLRRIARDYPGTCVLIDPGAPDPGVEPGIAVEADAAAGAEVMPMIDAQQVAAVCFTSGSTGQSLPHAKTWGSLARGAAQELVGLGLEPDARVALLGTVPPQHMYGLESTVVLALRCGFAVHAGRPLYPADVVAALAQLPAPRVLVTAPIHLRTLLAEGVDLPALHLIVCATAPLAPELALQAEAKYHAPVREIYGFTEAGIVATRRPAQDSRWRTLPGVCMRRAGGEVRFAGGHIEREVAAADQLEVIDQHTFVLRGRGADLVNVAGKRTSLAYLNHELASVAGVEDGVFFVPEAGANDVTRPMAFVVAPGLSREALLAALRARIDPVFLPRPLHFVEALPRTAAGKLPREALAELAARCAARPPAAGTVRLLAEDHPAARGHFPGNSVVPAAVILDQVLRTAEARFDVGACGWEVVAAKFPIPARPGEDLCIELTPDGGAGVRFECFVGARAVAGGVLRRLGGSAGATPEAG